MAKKKWFSKLTTLFSKPNNSYHTNSQTTVRTRSPSSTVNRRTSQTTVRTRSPTRTVNRRTSQTTVRTTNRAIQRTNHKTQNHTHTSSNPVHRSTQLNNSASRKKTYSLTRLKPKGTILNQEDFKCIFCFQLPTLPADEKRGIIICPNCGHPAHADEFRNWLKNSRLCSRCDRPISINFIQHIEIIPTVVYIKAMKVIMKKGANRIIRK